MLTCSTLGYIDPVATSKLREPYASPAASWKAKLLECALPHHHGAFLVLLEWKIQANITEATW